MGDKYQTAQFIHESLHRERLCNDVLGWYAGKIMRSSGIMDTKPRILLALREDSGRKIVSLYFKAREPKTTCDISSTSLAPTRHGTLLAEKANQITRDVLPSLLAPPATRSVTKQTFTSSSPKNTGAWNPMLNVLGNSFRHSERRIIAISIGHFQTIKGSMWIATMRAGRMCPLS